VEGGTGSLSGGRMEGSVERAGGWMPDLVLGGKDFASPEYSNKS
jgi:hypothetical protein